MKVVDTIAEMKQLRQQIVGAVGFVPTMGYLHEGHLSLVKQARVQNSIVVVSIFVNPAQFGPKEDFSRYPRDIPHDLKMLKKVGTDIVFMPSPTEMYQPGFNSWVDVEKVTERLEGAFRPGHFRGVTTIVVKLFNIVQPNKAYFGQKDAQQALVIRKMVADLNMNLEIIVLPTLREPDGLAMSSRNTYLKPEERRAAVVLYHSLTLARHMYARGERDAEKVKQKMLILIGKEPLATVDYVSIANAETLDELDKISPPALISMAIIIGKTRLIDNVTLD